jgi:hypothetical protein
VNVERDLLLDNGQPRADGVEHWRTVDVSNRDHKRMNRGQRRHAKVGRQKIDGEAARLHIARLEGQSTGPVA